MKKGLLIVVDGTDGSGKTTQVNLLSQYLKEKGIDFEVISFPQYGKNEYAKKVEDYLNGKLGRINEVDPYLVANFYAGDRLTSKQLIDSWLEEGKVVIANRYVPSSKAHLGANLPEEKRQEFFKWLEKLEYEENKQSFSANKMPKEDLVILLKVDPSLGQKNVQSKDREHDDLHEDNLDHLIEANKIYLQLAKQESNWVVVDCMRGDQMREKKDIHQEIIEILKDKFTKFI